MIEKQDKYFAEKMDDEYFMIIKYTGKMVKNGIIYSSDVIYKDRVKVKEETVKSPDEISEINISVIKADTINLIDHIVMSEMKPLDNGTIYKVIISKDNISSIDKMRIAEFYDSPIVMKDYNVYKEESMDLFFERFRIRN